MINGLKPSTIAHACICVRVSQGIRTHGGYSLKQIPLDSKFLN